jgi:hypothetical protein
VDACRRTGRPQPECWLRVMGHFSGGGLVERANVGSNVFHMTARPRLTHRIYRIRVLQ